MRRVRSGNFHFNGFGSLLYRRMKYMVFLSRSLMRVNTTRVMTSRWMRANQFSTRFSHEAYVGVKCS